MSTLHLLAQGPHTDVLEQLQAACADGDGVLLLEDGVYLGLTLGADLASTLPGCAGVYALREHVLARGMEARLQAGIELVDYPEFVRLVTTHRPVVSWYR